MLFTAAKISLVVMCFLNCDGVHDDDDSGGLCICTREYAPLCCDDIDYGNACLAECDGVDAPAAQQPQCKAMRCDERDQVCKCTKELRPWCCDGTDYDNACLARCDGVFAAEYFCQRGRCDAPPLESDPTIFLSTQVCTLEIDPICCDGIDYANPCFAEKDGGFESPAEDQSECKMGRCEDACKCTRELNPICCDGKTYGNPCLAECSGVDEPAEDQSECELGRCRNACVCDSKYEPICCDDKEFSNACVAVCNGFQDADKNKECRAGRCNSIDACSLEWDPYCCDGKTYGNPCLALKSGISDCDKNDKCTSGECSGDGGSSSSSSSGDGGEGGEGCEDDDNEYCCSKVTYTDACEAEDDGFTEPARNEKCKLGKCKNWEDTKNKDSGDSGDSGDVDACTADLNPICCVDDNDIRITYDNPCLAEKEGGIRAPAEEQSDCTMGECQGIGECACAMVYAPVCCTDDDDKKVEFSSLCDAECVLKDATDCSEGKCDTGSGGDSSSSDDGSSDCAKDYVPVCCYDTDDYSNECMAECALKKAGDLFDDVCVSGSCASLGCECTKDMDPFCCDGKTFDNECVVRCNDKNVDECSAGECPTAFGAAAVPATDGFNGVFSLNNPTGASQWNIMIVIIQLCILAVCCLSLGLSISFCFKNPNSLISAPGVRKVESYGRDQ